MLGTGTWGANWTCCDKCCRCDCCWDAGEYDPNNRPGDGIARKQEQQKVDQEEGDANAPPAYKATDQMTITPNNNNQQAPVSDGIGAIPNDATPASQPQVAAVAAASNAGRTQAGVQ